MKDLIVEKYMNFINWIRPEKRKLKTFAQKVTKTYFNSSNCNLYFIITNFKAT